MRRSWRQEQGPWLARVLVAVPILGLVGLLIGVLWPPGADVQPTPGSLAPLTSADWMLRLFLATCLSVGAVLGPGLVLRTQIESWPLDSIGLAWVPGVLLLTLTGLLCWWLEPSVDPGVTSAFVLTPVFVCLAWSAWRLPAHTILPRGDAAVVGLVLIALLICTAKATWSPGPSGELYGGTISRTLEPDRPDSRISYHVVQLVSRGINPYGPTGQVLFLPYTFSDRGPLAGLAATPVVTGTGGQPPTALPQQPWSPFDSQGFAAYRIVLGLLEGTVVLAAFGLVRTFLSRRLAWACAVLVAMTPFVLHDIYFTWPKLLAASFGIAALTALIGRHRAIASFLLGCAYLTHPIGIFVFIAVAGIWLALAVRGPGSWCRSRILANVRVPPGAVLRNALWLVGGVAVAALSWAAINGSHYTQTGFLDYPSLVYGVKSPGLLDWVGGRLHSLGNTLVPLELFVADHADPQVNAFNDPHGPWAIPFFSQYWTSVPFAVGIVYFPIFSFGLWSFARRSTAVFLAGLALPFVAFAVFWGSFTTGLMREGLQCWIVLALIAAFLGHTVESPGFRRLGWRIVRVCVTLRGIEVLALLLIPTISTDRLLGSSPFLLTDVLSLAAMVAGVSVLMLLSWRAFGEIRRDQPQAELASEPRRPL